MTLVGRLTLFFIVARMAMAAPTAPRVDEREASLPPTAERLSAMQAAAQRDGWSWQEKELRATARRAYEREKLPAAGAWLNVCRWAALLGRDESDFTVHWIHDVQAAGLAHANMSTRYRLTPGAMSRQASPELQRWLIGHAEFSEEFFATIAPFDYQPRVLEILDEIFQREPAAFEKFANLALAIAVVYDVPPPPDWPHPQVTPDALPRRWPEPLAAFRWWTHEAHLGHLFQRLDLLGCDELKFVVDAAAPFDDLEWSQQVANYPLNQLARAYTMIPYRADRATASGAVWRGKAYSLPAILGAGGICVDQAFFATQVGKARGVPTLLFHGAGNDARHAWFGFLDGNQKWQLDAGRYAEQKFVTGFARDPQTWREISDHELKFLAERFRGLASFRRSRVHADFAADYLATGDPTAAIVAAEKAVTAERRDQAAWETLLAAQVKAGAVAGEREGTLRRAREAFQLFPDLEVLYANRLSASLRVRGQSAAADAEQQRIARRYRGDRSDLALQEARDVLLRSIATQPLVEQIRAYNSAVDKFGRGAGIAFFDQIVRGFVAHLMESGQPVEAEKAANRARFALKVERGSQLDQEFEALLRRLKPRK